ncbi:MAG: hypothetical protein N2039_15290, partial [Gemmataceae bacterium]|nr:hypothetical protein [Gemmataceae bacterium]
VLHADVGHPDAGDASCSRASRCDHICNHALNNHGLNNHALNNHALNNDTATNAALNDEFDASDAGESQSQLGTDLGLGNGSSQNSAGNIDHNVSVIGRTSRLGGCGGRSGQRPLGVDGGCGQRASAATIPGV